MTTDQTIKNDKEIEALIAKLMKEGKEFEKKSGRIIADLETGIHAELTALKMAEKGIKKDLETTLVEMQTIDAEIVLPAEDEE